MVQSVLGKTHQINIHIDGPLLISDRIIIPSSMWLDVLNRIHKGHLGIKNVKGDPGKLYFGLAPIKTLRN